jgi:hypothetical protein
MHGLPPASMYSSATLVAVLFTIFLSWVCRHKMGRKLPDMSVVEPLSWVYIVYLTIPYILDYIASNNRWISE